MRYIMIDTNYFVANKFDTEKIILKNFKKMITEGLGVFLYNEVLLGEYQKQLDKLIEYSKDGLKSFLSDKKTLNSIIPMFGEVGLKKKVKNYEQECLIPFKNQFINYVNSLKGYDTLIDHVSVKVIVDKYLNTILPFEVRGEKKNEFPDAIIYESVINWMSDDVNFNPKKDTVYFVTSDKGLGEAFNGTLVRVVTDLNHCLLSLLDDKSENIMKENIDTEEFNQFLEKLLEDDLINYIGEQDLDIEIDSIEAEAMEYRIIEVQVYEYELLTVNRDGENLKFIIEISDANAYLEVKYTIIDLDTGYFNRETGEVFGIVPYKSLEEMICSLKLIVEFSIEEKGIFAKKISSSINDTKTYSLILEGDLNEYVYMVEDINKSVMLEIEDIKLETFEENSILTFNSPL
ncbi:DUF4935 domain-containing protein [Listeria welshimeri]|nr:DUF4935 domain-containing protein [Listeria welshimeri]